MNNNINSSRHTMMPPIYPESDEEEELSESYNINDDVGGQESDCSDGSSSASSSKTAISSPTSSTSGQTSNLSVDGEDETSEDDDDDDEDDEDGTTTQSDELELAQLTEQQIFRLPRGLCENVTIFNEFFSLETWQMLTHSMQAQLQPLLPNFTSILPPALAAAEVQRTVTQLFNGGVQRFGVSPMAALHHQLEEGNLRPEVRELRRSIERSKRRERRFQHCERLSKLARELFISREQLLRNVYAMPPDEALGKEARTRKRKSPCLQIENKFFTQRARKRYCLELYELSKELDLKPGDISADDDDEDPEAMTAAEREEIAREWAPIDTGSGPPQTKPSNAADKKCIYNTFFRRRYGVDDEHVLRSMQAAKIPRLNDKNFKKYLRDYKRRKLAEPDLPDFDTTDIRLRDVCTRAQFVGSFKPGRKPKALTAATATITKLNEPPALVPISTKSEPELLTDEPQQVYGRAAVEDDDEGLDLGIGFDNITTESMLQQLPQNTCSPQSLPIKPLPKLEPLSSRSPQQQQPIVATSKLNFGTPPNKVLVKTSTASTHITGSPTREQLSTDTHMHACYFSLLRDFFVATPNHRMTYAELQTLVVAWRDTNALAATPPVSPNDWYRSIPDWTLLLQSAINFLSGEFAGLPVEYVPYIEYKTQLNIYQWIGAGRDSDARLVNLCNYWLHRRKELKEKTPTSSPRISTITQQSVIPGGTTVLSPVELGSKMTVDGFVISSPTPPPRWPTSWTVRTATQQEVQEFQRQERLRFEQPHRPFTYRMYGYESVVGPVKGIYTQTFSLNKARGHAVMVADRPPYVTILTLVRDATARLPNGEGTRAEISELLKCSQFINQNAAENVLQTIVSGALDRMHAGLDPCVRYDAKRKIWIYLHRNRSEAEFELMHKNNQSVIRQQQQKKVQRKAKPKKEGETTTGAEACTALAVECPAPELPALVPAAAVVTTTATKSPTLTAATLLVKKVSPLPVKCPPVPPLKYNIPATSVQQQQQKSLLKSPLQTVQRSGMVTLVDKQIVKTTPAKSYSFPLHSPGQTKINPTRNTTPILVSTPTGLQTVHVATTPHTQTQLSNVLPTAGKKLAIKKPIVISHLGSGQAPTTVSPLKQPQQQQVGSFIIPLDQQQQQPKEQQHMLVEATAKSLTVGAISPRQQMPKNIIRLMPASPNNAAAQNMLTKQSNTVQIIAPRMLAQTQVRPVQQKIGAVSIVSNKPAVSTAASATTTGTIVKMSPQAFASLQHKQLLAKTTTASNSVQQMQPQQQPQQQQRILVGNTAISSSKNIVFQALPPATFAGQTKPTTLPKILTTTSGKSLNTANLSPQQQRIVLQNFKQQAVQFKAVPATVVEQPVKVSNMTTVSTTAPATAAVASQTMPRVVRTATAPQTGQIITLDSLLQKQTTSSGSSPKLLNASPSIIQLATSSSGTHLIGAQRNVITLAHNTQQRLVTTTQAAPKLATAAAAGRIITTNAVPKVIGKTTVLSGGGKPLVLHAKTLNTSGGVTLKNVASTTATQRPAGAAATQLQNIVIGGQTVKLQSASNLPRSVTATSGAGTTPMQTLIMGNQVLRLQHVSTAGATTITNSSSVASSSVTSLPTTSSGIASAPKTLVIGTGGQTIRLNQAGGLTKNLLVTGNKTSNAGGITNNVVFAVQGGGGQLFFSPTLQGMNLKPLSNMKVVPMANATGVKMTVATAAAPATAVPTVAGGGDGAKKTTQKMLPQVVLKTGSASGN